MKPRFLLEYAGVRLLDLVLSLLSWESCQAFGAFVGRTAARLGRRRWAMTVANVAAAFPGKSPSEHEAIALQAWENAGRIAAEFCRSRHLTKDELLKRVHFENLELVDRMKAEGRGALHNIGHLGNWEVGGIAFTALGYPLGVVGRVMRNPLLDRWLNETRGRFGESVFAHRNPFFQVVRWLKGGKLTAVLIDHNLYQGGIFVPFFGRPAATSTLSGLLSVKLDCPIISTRVRREGSGLVVSFHGPLRPRKGADPEAEAERLTRAMTQDIEDFVRERPGEWLWGHNRWKRTDEAPREDTAEGRSSPAAAQARKEALILKKRKFRLAMSGRLHRFDPAVVAAEAVGYPGCYELVVIGGDGKPCVAYVGVALESIQASLEAHLEGSLRPSPEDLAGLSSGGKLFFEFVSSSDIDCREEHQDIAGALIARHKPRFNEGTPPSTGKFSEVEVEEA